MTSLYVEVFFNVHLITVGLFLFFLFKCGSFSHLSELIVLKKDSLMYAFRSYVKIIKLYTGVCVCECTYLYIHVDM